jgi:hypothetical protein
MVLPFKTLERKVAAFLPEDLGRRCTPAVIDPRITVSLRPEAGTGETRIRLLDSVVGAGERGFARLDDGIARIHRDLPEAKGEIDAGGEVPHGAVVRTLDAFLKAGVFDVTFIGAPPPRMR